MGKTVMTIALSAALIRAADNYLYFGKYTDAFVFMMRDMLRWFGV